MEYSMNMMAKLLHTSIVRISPEGKVIKRFGNQVGFHITYVLRKYQEDKKNKAPYPYLINLYQGVTTAVLQTMEEELYIIGPVSFVEYKQLDLAEFIKKECAEVF